MKIGVLLYTYNRTDDARINLEIIRNTWPKDELFKDVTIVHSYNGERDWWPEKYLEDELIYLENPGHFLGAELLINEGMNVFKNKYSDTDYVILLASDTWCVKPEYLSDIVRRLKDEDKYLATCVWGSRKKNDIFKRGAALDFCIFDFWWVVRAELFPLHYKEFLDKYKELFLYQDETPYLEVVFITRFLQAIERSIKIPSDNLLRPVAADHIYRLSDREPVHEVGSERRFFKRNYWERYMYWPKMELITHHDPIEKQKVLRKWNLGLGEYGKKFLAASDLTYYNHGLNKHTFSRHSKKIDYGD